MKVSVFENQIVVMPFTKEIVFDGYKQNHGAPKCYDKLLVMNKLPEEFHGLI